MSTPQDTDEVIRLELPATLKYLNVLSACISGILARVEDLDERDAIPYTVQLGIHEVCTNIVQHAYAHTCEQKRILVTMEMKACPRSLHMTLFDTGQAFDQETVQDPNLDEGQVHGYGLFLAKNIMDEVTYNRLPDGNYWRLVKLL